MDEQTEYWHTHDTNCSLREYLGMTFKEYELWVKRGDSVYSADGNATPESVIRTE